MAANLGPATANAKCVPGFDCGFVAGNAQFLRLRHSSGLSALVAVLGSKLPTWTSAKRFSLIASSASRQSHAADRCVAFKHQRQLAWEREARQQLASLFAEILSQDVELRDIDRKFITILLPGRLGKTSEFTAHPFHGIESNLPLECRSQDCFTGVEPVGLSCRPASVI